MRVERLSQGVDFLDTCFLERGIELFQRQFHAAFQGFERQMLTVQRGLQAVANRQQLLCKRLQRVLVRVGDVDLRSLIIGGELIGRGTAT